MMMDSVAEVYQLRKQCEEQQVEIEVLRDRFRESSINAPKDLEGVSEVKAALKSSEAMVKTLTQRLKTSKKRIEDIKQERDEIIVQTESDAERVQELWGQTLAKHNEQKSVFETSMASFTSKVNELCSKNEDLQKELEESNMTIDTQNATIEILNDKVNRLEVAMEEKNSEIEKQGIIISLAKERLHRLGKHADTFQQKLKRTRHRVEDLMQQKLRSDAKLEKYDRELRKKEKDYRLIREEIHHLVTEHETMVYTIRNSASEKENVEFKLREQLENERKYSENIINTFRSQLGQHDTILVQLNNKLSTVTEKNRDPESLMTSCNDENKPKESLSNTMSIFGVYKPPVGSATMTNTSKNNPVTTPLTKSQK